MQSKSEKKNEIGRYFFSKTEMKGKEEEDEDEKKIDEGKKIMKGRKIGRRTNKVRQ